jgi:CheY-like chemotaxis protein
LAEYLSREETQSALLKSGPALDHSRLHPIETPSGNYGPPFAWVTLARAFVWKGKTGLIKRPTVLIVEDFEDLRKLVGFYLGARGYQVLEAANGRAAIQTALSENPDFILLDLRLPDLNGIEVARELRKAPQTENIPIVGWSADSRLNQQRKSLQDVGVADYLEKPTTLKDLDGVIERFLPKSKQRW